MMILEEMDSPIGGVLLVSQGGVLCALDFAGYRARMEKLLARHHGRVTLHAVAGTTDFARRLQDYFAGALRAVEGIRTAETGTPFEREVWTALRAIPPGEARTYAALAASIGRPRAVRAVGGANARNPIAIVQPCHRVIGAGEDLTGYAAGLERKRWLLEHEGYHPAPGTPSARLTSWPDARRSTGFQL